MSGDPAHPTSEPAPVQQAADVEIVLRGSVAYVRGVVERLEDRERILQALASLDSITGVEDNLRLRAA